MELEKLLNKLIEKGWKPFGKNAIKFSYDGMETCCGYGAISYLYRDSYIDDFGDKVEYEKWQRQFNNRELVSKESGLRQFVCQNGMIRITENNSLCNWLFGEEIYYDETQTEKLYKNDNYEYWLIESALCDEEDLEKFLLENIKIS